MHIDVEKVRLRKKEKMCTGLLNEMAKLSCWTMKKNEEK